MSRFSAPFLPKSEAAAPKPNGPFREMKSSVGFQRISWKEMEKQKARRRRIWPEAVPRKKMSDRKSASSTR